MDEKFRSRKFILASAFAGAGVVGLFLNKLSGSEFIALVAAILALYGVSNVVAKKVEYDVMD